ncbi:hypothetical protein [Streptomyces sp. NPDC007369]|uniref:hypothetical protein n=1 Tax=Streptomyces sp. NPDC007369 TaxID=3154589 RepID=UPI0033E94B71
MEEAAYRFLPQLLRTLPEPDGSPPGGFLGLHRGGLAAPDLDGYLADTLQDPATGPGRPGARG